MEFNLLYIRFFEKIYKIFILNTLTKLNIIEELKLCVKTCRYNHNYKIESLKNSNLN